MEKPPPWNEYMTPPLKSSTSGTDVMPKRLVSHGESFVSTRATLILGSPRASREAASVTAIFSQVATTRAHRGTESLQNSTNQSPDVAPVAACVKCSKFFSSSCTTCAPKARSGMASCDGMAPPRSSTAIAKPNAAATQHNIIVAPAARRDLSHPDIGMARAPRQLTPAGTTGSEISCAAEIAANLHHCRAQQRQLGEAYMRSGILLSAACGSGLLHEAAGFSIVGASSGWAGRPADPLPQLSYGASGPSSWAPLVQLAAPLLASAALLAGALPALAENELAELAQGQLKPELIDPQCFAKSCKLQTTACAESGDCMKGLTCAAKCMGDTECTVGCFARYGNQALDDVLSCTIEDASCLKIAIVVPGADGPLDAPMPPKALVPATPASMSGKWYKVMGFNSNYDCYECQRNSFKPEARQQAINIGRDGQVVDVDVEYTMPRDRAGSASKSFHAKLHEQLVFDTTPGSHRTAHTQGKMFGLTFWENWYVIGANDRSEDPFRIVYYTGKTLQNKYEGAFVYARKPELPASAMPHIYKIAREAGFEPTDFCAIDNKCFNTQETASATPPPFTPVAIAADSTRQIDQQAAEALLAPSSPLDRLLRDAGEFLEDPRPYGKAIFSRQKRMSEIREFDFNGKQLPSENFRTSR